MSHKKLSIKQLELYLQNIDEFVEPKMELEQYATPPHIAALVLNTIDSSYDDLDNKIVADLGCGTGRLTIGSLMIGAKLIYGFDVDELALRAVIQNVGDLFSDDEEGQDPVISAYKSCEKFNLIQVDIASTDCAQFWRPWEKIFDTVIMNPPFGTKQNQGMDMIFLKRAIDLSHNSVYSLHKTSTRDHIIRKTQQWNVKSAKPIAQIRYNLANTYKFHRRKNVDIDVDLWRISV